MADYKELLRRAVAALPENNGAARRAVYEKARAALVGQLRAINPPLAARDITAHRLQLEDCIRQVEQEASEAVIAGMGGGQDNPPPPPVYFEPQPKKALPGAAKPVSKAPTPAKEPPKPLPQGGSIEEIIAAANAEQATPSGEQKARSIVRPEAKPVGKPGPKLVPQRPQVAANGAARQPDPAAEDADDDIVPSPVRAAGRPLPSIVARAEAAKGRTSTAAFGAPVERQFEGPRRGPVLEPRRELAARGGNQAVARQQVVDPVEVYEAPEIAEMPAEIEAEIPSVDPQGAIDRAIATLDREARAEADIHINGAANDVVLPEVIADEPPARANGHAASVAAKLRGEAPAVPQAPVRESKREKPAVAPAAARAGKSRRGRDLEPPPFPRARAEDDRGGISAVTIFLVVFVVLLLGAGGAGYWAVQEGFIDLNAMFSQGKAAVAQAPAVTAPAAAPASVAETPATGPGNTDTPAQPAAPAAELKQDDRLAADVAAPPAPVVTPALPLVDPGKSEERLNATVAAPSAVAETEAVAAVDPASLAGSQSLLLEASANGTTGAVPFSGTVEWSTGKDEMGLPTLIGKANIPARNLAVDVLIRKNSDPILPASHIMEINFKVSDGFIGGSVAGLPGVLLKNEELVQGTPMVGASARVVGNSFLFALSASPGDETANMGQLASRKWIDLALIYATGRRAIITLEKDDKAMQMFNDVIAAWGNAKTAAAAN